ncbi:MAG: UbiX family flavin prenyltransferase [Candidatus Hadarchaeales archaeon]
MRVVVGMTGASGAVYGVRFLEVCREMGIETELVISDIAEKIISLETGKTVEDVKRLASTTYDPRELAAPIASGSYPVDGMVVIPCSMGTLGAIASGASKDLITRAAEVTVKQGRKLILVWREAPVSVIQLENMVRLAMAGAVLIPAAPAFYHLPKKIEDLIDFIVGKVFEALGVDHKLYKRWGERPV